MVDINRMKSHEIGQLVLDNWQRIDYRCKRATDRVDSDIRHGRPYAEVQHIEWTSPEGVLFWLYMDYRHQVPVLVTCIVAGTKERPQFIFPQSYIDSGGAQMDLYTCHFMERYRQRQLKAKLPTHEVVRLYAFSNISSLCVWRDADDGNRVFAVREGLAFAKADRTYNRWVFTTYVSNAMLGDSQREAKEIVRELLDRQDALFNGTRQYSPWEWDALDAWMNVRLKRLRPLAQEIYNSYFEDSE